MFATKLEDARLLKSKGLSSEDVARLFELYLEKVKKL